MKALITGASSGIGRAMAEILSEQGHDLILVARRKDRLEALQQALPTQVEIIPLDLSSESACFSLYEQVREKEIDILINNAGYGVLGPFHENDLTQELGMIDLNIKALHILTKLFLQDFKQRDSGFILNVASAAAFLPGPLLAAYYASKAYVLRLTEGIYEELRREGSRVYVGALCPGPVDTEFNQRAGARGKITGGALTSEAVARYAIEKMFDRKLVIIPGFQMGMTYYLQKLIPRKLLLRITYDIQKRKLGFRR